VEIRALGPADAAAYRALRLRGLREHPEAFGSSYEESRDRPLEEVLARFARPESVLLGAEEDGRLIGTVSCQRETYQKARHRATITGMYVAAEAQGRGVGGALLDAAIGHARGWAGLEQVHLTVVTANAAAGRLYRGRGFVVYGLELRALKIGDRYVDEELMVLDLRG
jgi:ribosomal protein S18 acetylase RimI-like enzyme